MVLLSGMFRPFMLCFLNPGLDTSTPYCPTVSNCWKHSTITTLHAVLCFHLIYGPTRQTVAQNIAYIQKIETYFKHEHVERHVCFIVYRLKFAVPLEGAELQLTFEMWRALSCTQVLLHHMQCWAGKTNTSPPAVGMDSDQCIQLTSTALFNTSMLYILEHDACLGK